MTYASPMGRLVMGIIVIAIMGWLGYRAMYGRSAAMPDGAGVSAPKQRLDNVQKAANRIEAEQEKSNAEALKKSQAE